MVSYRSAGEIQDYIVRSKLYPLEKNGGRVGCGNGRCKVRRNGKLLIHFDSFTTKKSYNINHKLDCNDKCLIYLFSCGTCGKQYRGNTNDLFRYRWNDHQMEATKAERLD